MDRLDEIAAEFESFSNDEEFKRKFYRLQYLMHEIATIKGWWNPPKTFGELIVMMHSELSEVIEAYRIYPKNVHFVAKHNGKPEGVRIELADLWIRGFDLAAAYNFPTLDDIITKATYNLKRSHRHGNKAL